MCATTWVNFENIMQSEGKQTQKDKYWIVPLKRGTQNSQVQINKKQICGYQGLREGENVELFNGYRVPVQDDENVLVMDGDSDCKTK